MWHHPRKNCVNLSRVSCKMLLLARTFEELKGCSFMFIPLEGREANIGIHWQVTWAVHTAYSASVWFLFHLGFGQSATLEGAVETSFHEDEWRVVKCSRCTFRYQTLDWQHERSFCSSLPCFVALRAGWFYSSLLKGIWESKRDIACIKLHFATKHNIRLSKRSSLIVAWQGSGGSGLRNGPVVRHWSCKVVEDTAGKWSPGQELRLCISLFSL